MDLVIEWSMAFLRPDGILWSTLGLLLFNPGRLTRDWWEGKRIKRMSPVRTLFAVVVLGSILSVAQSLLYPGPGGGVGTLIQVFTFQTAIVGTGVFVAVMPHLLPRRLARSLYQHTVFALYESAFLGLLVCGLLGGIVLTGSSPGAFAMLGFAVAPLVVPMSLFAIAGHAVLHVRNAYGIGLLGAVARVVLLGVLVGIVSLMVAALLMVTGVPELWQPI